MSDPQPAAATTTAVASSSRPQAFVVEAFYNEEGAEVPQNATHLIVGPKVRKIPPEAFKGRKNLRSIVFAPDSKLRKIGEGAFRLCTNLRGVALPRSLKTLGTGAFWKCGALATLEFADGILLESIDYETFYGCAALTSVEIPPSVGTVDAWAFQNCTGLERVGLGRAKDIGDHAFQGCRGLARIVLPGTLRTVGKNAFRHCAGLREVGFATTGDDRPLSLGDGAFAGCHGLKRLEIPARVQAIGAGAFSSCDRLKEVTVHDGGRLEVLGDGAFQLCGALERVSLPDSLKDTGRSTFKECAALESCRFAETGRLRTIGEAAFCACRSLTGCKIPASVRVVSDFAFCRCEGLRELRFAGGAVESIGQKAFSGCGAVEKVRIPPSVQSIGDRAFADCDSLRWLDFAEHGCLETIGEHAFSGCGALPEVLLPGSLEHIGEGAFARCGRLALLDFGEGAVVSSGLLRDLVRAQDPRADLRAFVKSNARSRAFLRWLSDRSCERAVAFQLMLRLVMHVLGIACFLRAATSHLSRERCAGLLQPELVEDCPVPGATDETRVPVLAGVLFLPVLVFTTIEIRRIATHKLGYWSDPSSWLDLGTIACVGASAFFLLVERTGIDTLLGITGILQVLHFLSYLKKTFLSFAKFLGGLIQLLSGEVLAFLVATALLLLGFSFHYFVLRGFQEDLFEEEGVLPGYNTLAQSYQTVFFMLFTGPLGTDPADYLYGVFVSILLLNGVVLVVVGNSWSSQRTREDAVASFYRSRFDLVSRWSDHSLHKEQVEPRGILSFLDDLDQAFAGSTVSDGPDLGRWICQAITLAVLFLLGLPTLGFAWPLVVRQSLFGVDPESHPLPTTVRREGTHEEEPPRVLEEKVTRLHQALEASAAREQRREKHLENLTDRLEQVLAALAAGKNGKGAPAPSPEWSEILEPEGHLIE